MSTIITTGDDGTLVLAAEVLGGARPNVPYIVESDGQELSVRPQNGHAAEDADEDDAPANSLSSDEWEQQWNALTEEMSAAWPAGVSAADVISEMRNARGQGFVVDN